LCGFMGCSMGGLFSKKDKSRITDQDKAILNLKKQRDQLKQYQKKIEAVLEKEKELAKKLLKEGKKDRAKLLLRKKKYQEGLLTRTDGQLDNLERLTQDLEYAQVEQQVIDGLKQGNEALKKANEVFSIDEIENIMFDTQESIDKQREIDDLISGSLTQEDEEDVQAEFDALMALEEEDVELPTVPTAEPQDQDVQLPEVPQDEPEQEQRKKEKVKHERVALEAS